MKIFIHATHFLNPERQLVLRATGWRTARTLFVAVVGCLVALSSGLAGPKPLTPKPLTPKPVTEAADLAIYPARGDAHEDGLRAGAAVACPDASVPWRFFSVLMLRSLAYPNATSINPNGAGRPEVMFSLTSQSASASPEQAGSCMYQLAGTLNARTIDGVPGRYTFSSIIASSQDAGCCEIIDIDIEKAE